MGRSLRIGIITAYPEQDWHSRQLIATANQVGMAVVMRPEQLGARVTRDGIQVTAEGVKIDDVHGFVLARGFGDRGNPDFLVPVYQYLARSGRVLVNDIDALLTAIDKFETSCRFQRAGLPTPMVVVAQDAGMARSVLQDWGRLVAKPLYGSLGLGIEFVEDTYRGRTVLREMLKHFGAVYLQEYIPTPGRDIRAFVVGDAVAASIYRIAAPGQFRTNIAHGGRAELCIIDAETAKLAVTAAQVVGLEYTGVDILEGPTGPVVLEVNGNPQWRGVLEATGHNMADDIMAWVVSRIARTMAKGGEYVA